MEIRFNLEFNINDKIEPSVDCTHLDDTGLSATTLSTLNGNKRLSYTKNNGQL